MGCLTLAQERCFRLEVVVLQSTGSREEVMNDTLSDFRTKARHHLGRCFNVGFNIGK